MARTFNGTSDKCTITTNTLYGTSTNVIPGTTGSGVRRSHPNPFILANGNLLLGYCTNEDFASGSSSFYFKCATSTDGGVTFGAAVTISNDSPTFQGAFAQLNDGTVVCAYGNNGKLSIRTSSDSGATWSAQTILDAATDSDCHPDILYHGSTLSIAYGKSSNVVIISAPVTGSTIGSWSAATTITASATEPSLRLAPDGELIVAYYIAGAIQSKRSTDSGVGATWGSAVTIIGTASNDPNLLIDGSVIWCVYPTNVSTQVVNAKVSLDNGVTWAAYGLLFGDGTYDSHRINGCLFNGSPIWFSAAINGDTDYHINRIVPSSQAVVNLRYGLNQKSVENLQTWTACAWIDNWVQNPIAGQSYILNKSVDPSTFIDRMFLGILSSGRLWSQIGRSGNATVYMTATSAFSASQWTFVAANFDDSRGAGNRVKFYIGTTPSNLAAVSPNTGDAGFNEGSGTVNNDTGGVVCIGGRTTDSNRGYQGDLGKILLCQGNLSLAQLQSVMRDTLPACPPLISSWALGTTPTDATADHNDGTYTGTTASGSSPPTFPGPVASAWATNVAGTSITATLSESGCTPTTGTGGFTLHGTTATVSSWAISGTTLTLTLSGVVANGDTVTIDYSHAAASSPIIDGASLQMTDFSGTSVTNNVPPPLVSGTASFVSSGPAGISVSATEATGGTSPYTHQWQRNSNGGSFSNLTGATSLSLTDLTATTTGVLYGYRIVYIDANSNTATSNTVTAQVYSGGSLGGGFAIGSSVVVAGMIVSGG